MYNSQFSKEFHKDIEKAKLWYKEQKEGLEIKFASAIMTTIDWILLMPEAYALRFNKVRIARPDTFPYIIYYCIIEETKTVYISAILHNKRNPKIAFNRIH